MTKVALMKDAKLLADSIDLGLGEAIVEIERLFIHAAGISRLDWIKTPSIDNWPDGLSRYKTYLVDRLAGVPLAYITGEKEFYGTHLQINRDVLCPRSETELLVDVALEKIRALDKASVLELGVGSGAVSIALALNHRGVEIDAVDISSNAIEVAQKNVDILGLSGRVHLRCGHWYDNVSDEYDLIVSNPPYIAEDDNINTIDSVEILWPDNTVSKLLNPETNQTLVIQYKEGEMTIPNKGTDSIYFKKSEALSFAHQEDNYNDFFYQKLIPYKVSTLGPAIAVADIDKNGFKDIFIGNSSGNEAKLFMNNGSSFASKAINDISNDQQFEDNTAVFIDIDNDNDLDLYVGSGINTSRKKDFENDRFYINNNGSFKKSSNKIPDNFLNTSCLAAYDYDGDGDEDLFIGNLSHTNYFGANVKSYILNNDGKGNFTEDANFKLLAQVTSASWEDINNDGTKDLLVSTQWDAPKVYINNNGSLELMQMPDKINGLWETITSYDIDKDGDQDILLGNWGLNTKLFATKDQPLHLYYNDFDDNGDYETILAYNKNGLYFPIHSKDQLASQMNIINMRFKQHKDYANNTVAQIVSDVYLKNAKTYEVHTLASGYIENDNGNFNNFIPFDNNLQLAPINSFSEILLQKENHLIVSGNSKKVSTYHGAYTSLKGSIIKSNSENYSLSKLGIKPFDNHIKKTEVIEMKDNNLLLVIQNNDSIISYSFNK